MDSSEPIRILIVEDSSTVAKMLKDLLEEEFSALVEITKNCASTREKLSSQTFDIIMLDYRLPDGHGHELLEETRAIVKPPLAVMVTGHGDEAIAALSLRMGASGYVVKDDTLSEALPEVMGKLIDEIALKQAEEKLQESEERYRLLVDTSMSGIFVHDGFNILYANEAVSTISGYPRDHFNTIKDVLDLLAPGERDLVVQHMKSRLAGEEVPQTYDTAFVRKDGSVANVQLMNTLSKLKGEPVIMVTVNDITDRKKAEEALKEQKAFIESALNAIPDVFCVFDLEGSILRWNNALSEVTGYRDEEISSMKASEFYGEDFQYGEESVHEMVEGRRGTFITTLLTKDHGSIPYELSSSLLRDHQGKLVAICTIGRDISARGDRD